MSDQADKVEKYLVQGFLDGTWPPGGTLPGERELAERLGVSRQNVQGVIQRLARDGWLTAGERRATRVNDFWAQGNLAVLNTLAAHIDDDHLSGFVGDLLAVRRSMAPVYALQAVRNRPLEVVRYLARDVGDAAGLAAFDFELHLLLAGLSGNRIYPMLLRSFGDLGRKAGFLYFSNPACREASRRFYRRLMVAAARGDARAAYRLTAAAMKESCRLWREIGKGGGKGCDGGTAGETTARNTF